MWWLNSGLEMKGKRQEALGDDQMSSHWVLALPRALVVLNESQVALGASNGVSAYYTLTTAKCHSLHFITSYMYIVEKMPPNQSP